MCISACTTPTRRSPAPRAPITPPDLNSPTRGPDSACDEDSSSNTLVAPSLSHRAHDFSDAASSSYASFAAVESPVDHGRSRRRLRSCVKPLSYESSSQAGGGDTRNSSPQAGGGDTRNSSPLSESLLTLLGDSREKSKSPQTSRERSLEGSPERSRSCSHSPVSRRFTPPSSPDSSRSSSPLRRVSPLRLRIRRETPPRSPSESSSNSANFSSDDDSSPSSPEWMPC